MLKSTSEMPEYQLHIICYNDTNVQCN